MDSLGVWNDPQENGYLRVLTVISEFLGRTKIGRPIWAIKTELRPYKLFYTSGALWALGL